MVLQQTRYEQLWFAAAVVPVVLLLPATETSALPLLKVGIF
jgi:hypothetical protein